MENVIINIVFLLLILLILITSIIIWNGEEHLKKERKYSCGEIVQTNFSERFQKLCNTKTHERGNFLKEINII